MSQGENFVFMASWSDVLRGYDEAGKPDVASEIAKQIIYYGVDGEMTTDDPIIKNTVTGMCATLIEKSKNRYKACKSNGQQGGRPQRHNADTIRKLSAEGLSVADIAEKLGCSKKTVQRALDDEI